MTVTTVKELKEYLNTLDENLTIQGYDGGDRLRTISVYTSHKHASEEEKELHENCLIISTD